MGDESRILVERAAGGDRAALDALLERHLPGLRAYLRLRSGPVLRAKESCSDLAQSVCRDVLENLDTFRFPGEAAFRAWLYTTAMRKVADRAEYWRAAKRDAQREALPESQRNTHSESDELRLLDCYRELCTPSQHAMGREALERIERGFERLPDDYREVIVLARLAGMSRKEIAEQMGRTEAAIRNLLPRALAQLADELAEV
ncbi:MAG: sigma-70 family RNA polymerase sigma factor [Planctomycetes bacterium]|nr:sigma-70 family RNA polymerase sigma factor [Planctomycetota bacterium]